MAYSVLPITGAWYGLGGNAVWNTTENLLIGYAGGGNYRSKIAISTQGLTIISSQRLVMEMELSGISSPAGIEGVLTRNNTIASNDCQNSSTTEASVSLNAAKIASSFAFADAAGTIPLNGDNGKDLEEGTKIYLIFDASALIQDQTYYLYLIRTHHDGYIGSGWTKAAVANTVFTLEYINYTACGGPGSFTAAAQRFENTVQLQWEAGTEGDNNAVSGYQLRYCTSADGQSWGDWQEAATTQETTLSHDPGIGRGEYVLYTIRTIGTAGEEYASEWVELEAAVRRNRAPIAPGALTADRSLINSKDEVALTWQAGSDPDDDLAGYILEQLAEGVWQQVYAGQALSHAVSPEGAAGETTQFRVCAIDSLAATSQWVYSEAITFNTAPSAPTQALADLADYSPGDTVTLTWSGAGDADGNIAGYIIGYRLLETDGWTELGSVQTASTSGSFRFVPEGAAYLQSMYLAVRTLDSCGSMSPWRTAGAIRRNDMPFGHIYTDGTPGSFVPHITQGNEAEVYMPYIRQDGAWVRYPGSR